MQYNESDHRNVWLFSLDIFLVLGDSMYSYLNGHSGFYLKTQCVVVLVVPHDEVADRNQLNNHF